MYKKYTELRDARSITDSQVSKDTGIAKSTLSEWKSGRSKPKVDKLIILAKYFDVPLGRLLGEEV
ncbi:MAG: helix-turn-helix transcriptional regulator [Eubacteriales bacterium]|nr:helix-turn-helix transcriptional regulator [Eubacteriales bacterium]